MGAGDPRADDVEEGLPGALGRGANVLRRNSDAAAAQGTGTDAESVYLAALFPTK